MGYNFTNARNDKSMLKNIKMAKIEVLAIKASVRFYDCLN